MVYVCRLVGKVAADNSHKWVFSDAASDGDPSLISSWNLSIEPVRQSLQFLCTTFSSHVKYTTLNLTFFCIFSHSNQEHGNFSSIQAFRLVPLDTLK